MRRVSPFDAIGYYYHYRAGSAAARLGGSPFSAEVSQFFSRLETQPTSARKTLYATMIDAIVTAGVWSKTDALYLFAAADAPTALVNLKSSSFTATATNSPTFTVDRGYAGNGTDSVVNTNFNPTTAPSPNFTQNSAHMGAWVLTNRAGASAAVIGNASADAGCNIYPFFTDTAGYLRLNDNVEAEGFSSGGSNGFFLANRSSSSARQGYKNGVSLGAYAANTSKSPINADIAVGRGGITFSTDQVSAAILGGSLNATEQLALYNALLAYLQGVGAV